eukprot:TRINITY_DN2164_c0_g1_i2.p1 TRINITY_DN2164_c0_g1~~TRINITY_DN2164_c0_g1_i2.p1  ORF type:complete len:260 (+),score=38.32 TRINITY_DN2164_c0_g1_i2:123-902(+)
MMDFISTLLGSVLRSLVGVAGGATRASVTEHQARRNNMGDVSAKDSSQETAVSLFGLLLGLVITPYIDTDTKTYFAFVILTLLHIFSNYRAVSSLVMDKLNRQRAFIQVERFLTTFDGQNGQVYTPSEVSKKENLYYSDNIKLGASLKSISDKENWTTSKDLDKAVASLLENSFYISADSENRKFCVAYSETASTRDILRSYFKVSIRIAKNKLTGTVLGAGEDVLFEKFMAGLEEKGWTTKAHLMGVGEWRCSLKGNK